MLISKFNRLIHNKWVWTIFVIVVVFAFIFSYGFSKLAGNKTQQQRNEAGLAEGEPVSPQALNLVLHFLTLNAPPMTEEEDKEVRKTAWKWLAAVNKAEKQMGFKVSDAELFDTIAQIPAFIYEGEFQADHYKLIVAKVYETSTRAFEEYVRQTILVEKLRAALAGAAWVPEIEVDEQIAAQTDTFSIHLAQSSPYTNAIEVSDENLTAYYEANTNRFMEPDRVSVAYISIPYSNSLADVSISTNDTRQYYEQNLGEFTTVDTNGNDIVAAFSNVQENIVADLKKTRAQEEAKTLADEVLTLMFPPSRARMNTAERKDFWQAAAERSLTVSTTKLFSANEWLPQFKPQTEVIEKSFQLDFDSPKESFSDRILGEESVYLLAPVRRIPEHVPDLEEIHDRVMQAATADKRAELVAEMAEGTQAAVQKAISEGATFTNAITAQSMSMVTSVTFSVASGEAVSAPPFIYNEKVAGLMYKLNAGEFADPIVVGSTALIVQMTDRQQGELWARESMAERIENITKRTTVSVLFDEWQKLNLQVKDFSIEKDTADNDEERTTPQGGDGGDAAETKES